MLADKNNKPVIGVTMGDPAGVGAEVIIKALSDPAVRNRGRFIIYGLHELLAYSADSCELDVFWQRDQHENINRNYIQSIAVADYDEINWNGNNQHQPSPV